MMAGIYESANVVGGKELVYVDAVGNMTGSSCAVPDVSRMRYVGPLPRLEVKMGGTVRVWYGFSGVKQ